MTSQLQYLGWTDSITRAYYPQNILVLSCGIPIIMESYPFSRVGIWICYCVTPIPRTCQMQYPGWTDGITEAHCAQNINRVPYSIPSLMGVYPFTRVNVGLSYCVTPIPRTC